MRKTILTSSLILLLHFTVTAQSYNFQKTSGTYTNLSGSTSLTNSLTWDDPVGTIPLGFDLNIFDTTVSTLYFNDFFLGGSVMASNQETGKGAFISVFEADLMDRGYDLLGGDDQPGGLSNISFKVDGVSGSKICKIEWNNVGFYTEIIDFDTSLQYMNCQLWLYEGSNNIEMHYGPSNVTIDSITYEDKKGPSVCVFPAINLDTYLFEGDGVAVGGDVPNEFGYISYADTTPYLQGTPANGTIYRLTFDATSIKDVKKLAKQITMWPQPASLFVEVSTDLEIGKIVHAVDMQGKKVALNLIQNRINIALLPKGVYTLQFEVDGQWVNKRLSVL